MEFISIEYLGFLLITVSLYYFIPHRFRWMLILLSTYVFYALISIQFIPLLIISTICTYIFGRLIEKQSSKKQKKRMVQIGIMLLLSSLGWFKYVPFVNEILRELAKLVNLNYEIPYQEVVLPLAISYYTFQAISYMADIYFGKQKAEKHYGYFSLYIAFFPQLVAGPIERARKLLPQFKTVQSFQMDNITYGMKRIAWGFFKKTIIADRLAPIVSSVYDSPDPTGSQIVLATILFSIQLYADFSAVSDIAIGSARMLGIKLSENFNQPHFSVSIGDFWSRWHITFSLWLRDYIFIPLCRGKKKRSEIYVAIIITFLVSGIWHGVGWNFVIWGLLHGFYRVFGDATKFSREKLATFVRLDRSPMIQRWWKIMITFLLVCFSRVFFRSDSGEQGFEHAQLFLSISSWNPVKMVQALDMFSVIELVIFVFFYMIVHIFYYMERKYRSIWQWLSKKSVITRLFVYIFLVISILVFGVSGQGFVYGEF